MNKKTVSILITVFLVISQAACALAGNSITFTVTATIPLIPGMNAPLIETQEVRNVEQASRESAVAPQAQTTQQAPGEAASVIQQESPSTPSLANGKLTPVLTKTFYSR
ncbi:MAG: hypothetical protein PHR11_01945 [Candidatus Omnitrophica bacterium]|nr:hypothetical protein [Candidatus Omnitrophota bacterium]